MKSIVAIMVCFGFALQVLAAEVKWKIKPVVIPGNDSNTCSPEQKQHGLQSIKKLVNASLSNIRSLSHCGDGPWYPVASLNMRDRSQSCPSSWREYTHTTAGVRACGRFAVGCAGTTYSTGRVYSKVCGRIIGYQVASPDAFNLNLRFPVSANQVYVDGISITYGPLRTHLWTFAAGVSEGNHQYPASDCPCAVSNTSSRSPPAFVNNNYYCESGNRVTSTDFSGYLYYGDPIWDGLLCEGRCCRNGKSPPWFSVELNSPTSDYIEVRICGDQRVCDEDTPISLMEIYVQ